MGLPLAASAPAPTPATTTRSITSVIQLIKEAIKSITPQGPFIVMCQWIRPQANTGATKFFTVTLADQNKSDVAIQGICWDQATIQRLLKDGQRYGMNLEDRNARCEVALEVSIDCWAKNADPYLRIHRLNDIGMTGLKQRAKEAVIQALTNDGLLTTNKARPWRWAPLRLALITKPDSAGCEDARSILNRSGYAFVTTIIPVSVQGAHAETSILAAFRTIDAQAHLYDAVLLLRGGGNELDLITYDLLSVAQAVARCPLPVITGLGHKVDHSVCDVVSALAVETPTAAANAVVSKLQRIHEETQTVAQSILTLCQRRLSRAQQALTACTGPILRQGLSRIHQAKQLADQHTARILQQHGQDRLHRATQQLQTLAFRIRTQLSETQLLRHRHHLQTYRHRIHVGLHTALNGWKAHLQTLVAGIQSLDPERLMQRGFCYVTTSQGDLIRSPASLTPHSLIRIHFHHQTIDAIVTTPQEPCNDPRRTDPGDHSDPPAQTRRRIRRTPTDRTRRSSGPSAA